MPIYDYRIGDGTTVSQSGTLSSSGTAITGSGTSFTSDLAGVPIVAAGQTLCVASVADPTHLTLVTAPTVALSGAAWAVISLTNIEALDANATAPRSVHRPWEETRDTGDGLARGLGRPACTWNWGVISQTQRDALRAYCTGKAARVYIRTKSIDGGDAMQTYQAAMLWPDQEDRQATRRVPFTIEFRDMVLL